MTLNKISKAFFINLDHRKDRLDHINKNLPFSAERFPAVDAKNLELNDEIKKIFGKNLQKFTKAEIACSLSHYRLWKRLTLDKDVDNYLILEDDAVFKEGFTNFWNQLFSKNIPENYNLIYLGGCQPWNKPHYHKSLEKYNNYFSNIKKNDFFTKNDHFWHMNASSYILSKTAASLLCQWVEQNGIDDALDNFMQRFFNKNKLFTAPKSIYHLNPLMSYQLHEENDNTEIDKNSDIRLCEERFSDDRRISVVIPTIWMANDYMMRSLLGFDKVDCIEEVIVINNDKTKTPHWINAFKKVKVVDPGKRMYFNESVNLGIDLCKNDICCIYNDDITSDTRVFNYVKNNFSEKDGCIFISPEYINQQTRSTGKLKRVNDIIKNRLHHGSGMMMFVRKKTFIKIPENIIHHFGDIFIFKINQKQGRQNYIIEGFPIQTPGSASEDDAVKKVISQDWAAHKEVFDDLDQFITGKQIRFPLLREISNKEIPKKIHLSWKNKNIIDSDYELIKKGAKNLQLLNPDWDIEVYDDEDINKLLRDTIGRVNWDLIKEKKITEKTDLWRLIKTYQEGGLYIDIDRYIDTPLSEIINKKTAMFLPTFQDIDFSQDFILTCPKNPIIGKAIANNLNYRLKDESLFFLAVQSYMHSVSEVLTCKAVDRGNNPEYFNNIRNRIDSCEYLETFREIGPNYHALYRNVDGNFNTQTFEKDKADFYNGESVIHWNKNTQAKHAQLKNTNKQKIHNIITTNRRYDVCFCCDENLIRYAINPINAICEKNTDNNIVIHFIYSGKESDLCYIENVLVDKSNVIFKKYIVNSLDISINKTWRSIEHLSSATNLKLQIPEILKDVYRVIYFDIDTIPYVDLREFDKVKTDKYGIAMRQEIKNGWRTFNGSRGTATENKNPVDFGDRVIGNSGVMVLDLNELRKRKFTDFCIKEKHRNTYSIPLTGGDQDLINIFCECNFDVLPDQLNILVSDQLNSINDNSFEFKKFNLFQKDGVHYLSKKNVSNYREGILHFIGKDKPWNSDCLGSEFWHKFSLINKKISLHERTPGEIINYFNIDCQLTKNNLCNIVKEIQDKKCNCNMLVFGLGKDSIIYDTVNKGYTLFLETNQAWIDLNQNIKNKILYTFQTTVKDSLPINKEYLNKFDIPDFIVKIKWDIILVDAPPGDRFEAPGRALPIYWSSQIAKKNQATVFIDDCSRDLEKKYCDKFFPEIHFNVKSDTERGEFRVYKQKQSNILVRQHLETKQQQFIQLKDQWQNFKDYDIFKYLCREMKEVNLSDEKFSIYNPDKKIAIISLYTPEIADYAKYSEQSIKDYCEKQGYTFYIYREKLEKESNPNWSKAQALLNHIDDHEYIIWMDSDTLIFNPEKTLESIIQKASRKFILATKDIGDNSMLNSGVLFFKSHQYTKNLIKTWRDFKGDKSSLYASGGDQEILCEILKKSDTPGFNRKIFEMNEFNTDPRLVNKDTFILHFMAYPYELKKIFMSYWQNNFLTESL